MLTDDELRAVLARLGPESERDGFGLVCRRWLRIQSSERRRLRARAGPSMLRRLAARFPGALELDLSQSPSRSFYPGVIDDDLDVIAGGFRNLRVLALQNCKGETSTFESDPLALFVCVNLQMQKACILSIVHKICHFLVSYPEKRGEKWSVKSKKRQDRIDIFWLPKNFVAASF